MAKANKSRYAILGMLSAHPGSSGYDIRKMMTESTEFFWRETFSSIYPVLDELEKSGLISKQKPGLAPVSRNRKTYALTKEGKQELLKWLSKNVEPEQPRNELLLKIFFGQHVSLDQNHVHIEQYQRELSAKKVMLTQIRKSLPKEYADDPGLPFWLLTIEFGIERVQAGLNWCEFALKKLKTLRSKK